MKRDSQKDRQREYPSGAEESFSGKHASGMPVFQ